MAVGAEFAHHVAKDDAVTDRGQPCRLLADERHDQ